MNNKKLTPSIGILPLILLAALVQGCHSGSTTSSNAPTLSYTIPYSNTVQNPNTNTLNDPTINVQVFGESLTTPLDTGSRGFFLLKICYFQKVLFLLVILVRSFTGVVVGDSMVFGLRLM
ncbi:MAG: hypothetical protein K2Y14_03840 [Burkholderiales bacterium]|nr:hypothetical protein [Burkholderiales bacterium]